MTTGGGLRQSRTSHRVIVCLPERRQVDKYLVDPTPAAPVGRWHLPPAPWPSAGLSRQILQPRFGRNQHPRCWNEKLLNLTAPARWPWTSAPCTIRPSQTEPGHQHQNLGASMGFSEALSAINTRSDRYKPSPHYGSKDYLQTLERRHLELRRRVRLREPLCAHGYITRGRGYNQPYAGYGPAVVFRASAGHGPESPAELHVDYAYPALRLTGPPATDSR